MIPAFLLNPRVLAAAALVAALSGAYLWVDHRAYQRGATATAVAWQKREAEDLARVNVEIERLNREARAAEEQHAAALAGIALEYEEELQDAKRSHDDALARARAGTLRLRDPGATACPNPGPGPATEAAAGAGRRDGASGGELSGKAAQFLLELAAEADAVVLQLHACQRVVAADRQ